MNSVRTIFGIIGTCSFIQPIHRLFLGRDVLLLENLVNLDKIAGKSFRLYAFPLNFDLEATPARVVAEL